MPQIIIASLVCVCIWWVGCDVSSCSNTANQNIYSYVQFYAFYFCGLGTVVETKMMTTKSTISPINGTITKIIDNLCTGIIRNGIHNINNININTSIQNGTLLCHCKNIKTFNRCMRARKKVYYYKHLVLSCFNCYFIRETIPQSCHCENILASVLEWSV